MTTITIYLVGSLAFAGYVHVKTGKTASDSNALEWGSPELDMSHWGSAPVLSLNHEEQPSVDVSSQAGPHRRILSLEGENL
jgi:hypothetical protein